MSDLDPRPDVWHANHVQRLIAYAALAAVTSAGSLARAAEPTVLILPFTQPSDAHRDLGFGIELKVTGALRAMGGINLVHPKIRDSVMRRHTATSEQSATDQRGQAYARYVGADWTLAGRVDVDKQTAKVALSLAPVGKGEAQSEEVTAPTLIQAIALLPEAVLKLVNSADGGQRTYGSPVTPQTDKPAALARLGTCYRMLNQQSVGIRRPALLNETRVFQAANRCREALRRAPDLVEAEAGLAMIDALQGRGDDAKARLARIKDHSGFLAYYWMAKFWVLAKFFSPEQAVDALQAAVERNPGFMIGRGYLGEALSVLGRHKESLAAFRAYLKRVPAQPFVMARIGHELARLGRHKAAIAVTRKALALDPTNAETRLQLGSRFIDGGKFDAAIDVLAALTKDVDARGEIYLRLGYAQLQTNRLDEAEQAFQRALEKATSPQEWRTRTRAYYDLAKLHSRQKKLDAAFADLTNAVDAGFQSRDVFQKDADLAPLRADQRFAELMKRNPPPPEIPARYESPFLVDADELAKAAAQGGLRIGVGAAVDF